MGVIYLNLEQYDKAHGQFNIALETIKENSEKAKAQLIIANSYFKECNWAQAIREYQKVIEEYSEEINLIPKAYYGVVLAKRELAKSNQIDWSEVVTAANKAEETIIKFPAEKTIIEFLQDFPDQKLNTEELLENIRYIRDWEATSKLLESEYKYENEIGRQRAVSEASTDVLKKVRWQLKLGYLYSKKGKYNEAIVEYEKAIKVKPKSKKERETIKSYQLEAQYLRGESYFQLGKIQEAIDDFKEVLNNNPKDELAADTLYAKAKCYEKLADDSDERVRENMVEKLLSNPEIFIENCNKVIEEYPNTGYVNQAYILKGDVCCNLLKLKNKCSYHNSLIRYTEDKFRNQAIESYQKVPSDCEEYYEYAQAKITELQKGD